LNRKGTHITRTNPTDHSRLTACDASTPDAAARRGLAMGLLILGLVSLITACASLGQTLSLPSCSNVRGYFHSDVPLLRVFGPQLGNRSLQQTFCMAPSNTAAHRTPTGQSAR